MERVAREAATDHGLEGDVSPGGTRYTSHPMKQRQATP